MKYFLLIHQGDTPRPNRDGETNQAAVAAWEAHAARGAAGGLARLPGRQPDAGGHARACSSPRPRRRRRCASQDGRTLTTDGPFVETKEALGGYLIFEADDLDAAIELASRIPAARLGGAVEVRPIVEW